MSLKVPDASVIAFSLSISFCTSNWVAVFDTVMQAIGKYQRLGCKYLPLKRADGVNVAVVLPACIDVSKALTCCFLKN